MCNRTHTNHNLTSGQSRLGLLYKSPIGHHGTLYIRVADCVADSRKGSKRRTRRTKAEMFKAQVEAALEAFMPTGTGKAKGEMMMSMNISVEGVGVTMGPSCGKLREGEVLAHLT